MEPNDLQLWLPMQTRDRLAAMVASGLWGETMEEVALNLIREGIRHAITDGFLPMPAEVVAEPGEPEEPELPLEPVAVEPEPDRLTADYLLKGKDTVGEPPERVLYHAGYRITRMEGSGEWRLERPGEEKPVYSLSSESLIQVARWHYQERRALAPAT